MKVEGDIIRLEQPDMDGIVTYLAKAHYFSRKGAIVSRVIFPLAAEATAYLDGGKRIIPLQFEPVPQNVESDSVEVSADATPTTVQEPMGVDGQEVVELPKKRSVKTRKAKAKKRRKAVAD